MKEIGVSENKLRNSEIDLENVILEKKHDERYLVLGLYCLTIVVSQIGLYSFLPIDFEFEKAFRQGQIVVDTLILISTLTYVPINFFAIWVIESVGLRTSVLIGCFFQVIGFWMRYYFL